MCKGCQVPLRMLARGGRGGLAALASGSGRRRRSTEPITCGSCGATPWGFCWPAPCAWATPSTPPCPRLSASRMGWGGGAARSGRSHLTAVRGERFECRGQGPLPSASQSMLGTLLVSPLPTLHRRGSGFAGGRVAGPTDRRQGGFLVRLLRRGRAPVAIAVSSHDHS